MSNPASETLAQRSRLRERWAALALFTLTLAASAALYALFAAGSKGASAHASAARVRPRAWVRTPTDHAGMMRGPFKDGPAVTQACLTCHEKAATQVMHTRHFTWLGEPTRVPGNGPAHLAPTRIGKKNLINNYCISIESNWARCTSCHAGYGWKDADFDFADSSRVDCLVCHDRSGSYRKGLAGEVAAGVDLVRVAGSVGRPGRDNCGSCHFAGGGGDAVKHGDLDSSLAFPKPRLDVHMGRENMVCVDCHKSSEHRISGESMSVDTANHARIDCRDCHAESPHASERLNRHTVALSCQSCHIPLLAPETPTKMIWDWSTAGRDVPGAEPHEYMKEKGSFVYATRVVPEYYWYNGSAERYLKGDPVDAARGVDINRPLGSIRDPKAKIFPFKVHRGKQPYDAKLGHLLVLNTYGADGYWTRYDWRLALENGARAAGLDFSGDYGFVATRMYWPLSHMVPPKRYALGCVECHSEGGRLDWTALGYDGDPAFRGGRQRIGATASKEPRP